VNTVSLFGSAATPAAWIEILLGLSMLTMASALPEWQSTGRQPRVGAAWLPVGGLFALAVASVIGGVMQPELFAAIFSEI
jgi:hypothetical protein